MKQYDAIILGAGGAGLMCAGIAAQRGRKVLVIDHASEPGKKILISGGGRCNFTNLQSVPERYLSANPHFAKSALSRYTQDDFIALVNAHRIAWHEKTLGQLFCDSSARQIVDMLLGECAKGDAIFSYGEPVSDISHADGYFQIDLGKQIVCAKSLVVATGGPSIPKMGATGFAYDVARKFGLKIVEPRPALVPLTLNRDESLFRELSGVASDVTACCGKTAFREAALFTHKGLSGPSILQISSYWRHGDPVQIDFLPDCPKGFLLQVRKETPKTSLKSALSKHLPARLADVLLLKLQEDGTLKGDLKAAIASFSDNALSRSEQLLRNWQFWPNGTEGFAKAEVTIGGVNTNELSSKTMESTKMPGLYIIGEAVDVTGWLGGYNFQWAWSSGWAAGQAIR